MKRAALYMRVSSVDQHPETQLHDLHQMADQRGYEIVQEYTDRISGVKARRPGLHQMMIDARRGRFDVVLVWASDRIARSVRHFLEVLDELNHLNVEYVSFREQIDTGGPLGRAIVVIIGAVAEPERNLIVERVRAGMRRAKLEVVSRVFRTFDLPSYSGRLLGWGCFASGPHGGQKQSGQAMATTSASRSICR